MQSPARPEMEFWYDFASPYSYLAVSRIEGLLSARQTPIGILWRPFLLGPIFKRQTSRSEPFQEVSDQQRRYRRRDVERHCTLYGIPLTWPSVYPRGSLLATRVALVAAAEGWCYEFTRSAFHANFAEDRDIREESVVAEILRSLGRPVHPVIATATSPDTKARLHSEVEAAMAKGVFGAPSFVVRGEIFWGNDRLEQAIDWAMDSFGGPARDDAAKGPTP